ncbi:MAG: phosphodiester glycosidase family protein, partial [Bacilli bacterium]|nr:phosphodiester glycosidase family protein [Bacilli bacterium]
MKKHLWKKVMLSIFAILLLVLALPVVGQVIGIEFDTSTDDYNSVVSHKTHLIAPGITENTIILNDATGNNQNVGYTMEVDLNNPNVELLSGYKNMDPSNWGTQVTSEQAKNAAKLLNKNVVGAINTNLSWASDEPIGMLVIDGIVYHQGTAQAYFVLTKDGKAEIRDGSIPLQGNEWQATATFGMLVQNGVNLYTPSHATGDRAPRTAIGIKANGNVVLFVVDGRQAPYSVGMSAYELAQTMIDLGCVTAVNCDGGGTSTFVSKRSGTDELKVQNSPSDGVERPTLGTLMVVSKAKPSGEFDHAILSPNNDLYTPGSTIKFNAVGADSSGAKTELPEGVIWRLNEASQELGSIDATTGVFKGASEKVGVVTVEMVSNGNVVGQTSVELVHPDKVYFKSDEVSLGFSETTDLGLVVKYKNADVNFSKSDFIYRHSDDKMGKFNADGTYTTNDSLTINGTIIAQYKANSEIKAILNVVVGKLPTIVWDFEDVTVVDETTGETNVIPAKEYYTIDQKDETGKQIGKFYTSNYGRGGVQSAEIVSIDDDEPVRMGSHSLKFNYDFRNCGAVTEGACIGTTEAFSIPGSPTALGVWVYAPEGTGVLWNGDGTTSGLWLRGYYKDSTGNTCQYDFTFEPKFFGSDESTWPDKYPGIWWEGWRYCEAKLNGNVPYSILPGMTFRLMFVHATKMGERTSGSIYFDNFQFVYGSNVDDVDAPYVNQMHINYGTTQIVLEDGVTVNTNQMGFYIDYMDVENKYTSGIDASTTRMYIDGINVTNDNYYNTKTDNDGRNYVYGVTLKNGWHTITAYAKDNAGNELKETRRFLVKGDEDLSNIPDVALEPLESAAMLGGKMNLTLKTTDSTKVSSYIFGVKVDKNFPNYTVEFANGYEGTYKYNKLTKTIQIVANKVSDTAGSIVATISVSVPTSLKSWDKFSYSLEYCQYVVGDQKYTWSQTTQTYEIDCMYEVSADPILVGEDGIIRITSKGAALDNVGIYLEDGTLIGKTDANGELITNYFSNAPVDSTIYAMDDEGRLSFTAVVSSYVAQGDESLVPFGVMNHASKNGSLENNITWFTNPNALAQMLRYKVVGTTQWTVLDANSARLVFTKNGNTMLSIHSALISGLNEDTTYVYQVGDGNQWSKEYTFKTDRLDGKVKFFILGDIQTEDTAQIKQIIEQLNRENYNFGIQTGDAVDDATSYEYWMGIVELLGADALDDTNIIHVLGNHEFAGDEKAMRSSLIYNLPTSGFGGHYSVVYDSVYIAVINYTSNKAELATALEWIKQDAAKTTAAWKILVMHQPPYYTNTAGGNNEIHDMVPSAVEEAGIDFVFSGHDHSYARTLPMTKGKVDEENGVVYFIVGSTGEKSYSVTNNPDFNFARVISDYNSIYLYIEADYNKIDIRCMERGQYGEELDSYIKEKKICNHHDSILIGNTIECSKCEYKVALSDFTGLYVDETRENYYYADNGNVIQTWKNVNGKFYNNDEPYNGWWNDIYYFIDGVRVTGQYVINGIMYTFNEDGIYQRNEIFTGFYNDGKGWMYFIANVQKKGFVAIEDSTYYFDDKTGYAPIGSFTLAGNRVYKVEGEKGKVLGAWEYNDIDGITYKRYYYSLRYYKNKFVEIDGATYYFENSGYAATGIRALDVAGKYVGGYEFDKEGKLIGAITGPFTDSISGRMYFAENGELACNKLVKYGEDYYFARNNYYLITWPTYISEEQAKGLLPAGEYNFGKDGKLQMLNGPVVDAGNSNYLNFYRDGVRVYEEGLYEYNGNYYYVRSNGLLLTWGMYIEKTNNLVPSGEYKFGKDGKLQMLNGPVVDAYNSNYLNFYIDGVRVYEEGLYEYNGNYYYVRSNGLLLTWGMYIEKTNNLVPSGEYK